MEHVRVEFLPDGTVKIEAIGYSGPVCAEATERIRELLGQGQDVQEEAFKAEYYMQDEQRVEAQQ